MALIPIEGLGAPSQKTSLLGGVAQILIYLRPSPRLADVGLFVRLKSQHTPTISWCSSLLGLLLDDYGPMVRVYGFLDLSLCISRKGKRPLLA